VKLATTDLDFVYRSTHPGRDRGVMEHGRVLDQIFGYEIGLFLHDGDNARPRSSTRVVGDRTTAARVTNQGGPGASRWHFGWKGDFEL